MKYQLFKITLLSLLCVISSTTFAQESLFTAVYKGKHSGISITMERSLIKLDNSRYLLKSDAKSFVGSISELSSFSAENNNIVPSRYDYVRKVLGKKSKQYIDFDQANMTAAYRRVDKPKKNADYGISIHTLDPSLYQLKLQQMMYLEKHPLSFEFAKNGKVKKMDFQLVGKTHYTLNDKTYEAIEIERVKHAGEKKTNIILVPELYYQIAKVTHTEKDGKQYQVKLDSFEANKSLLPQFYSSIQ